MKSKFPVLAQILMILVIGIALHLVMNTLQNAQAANLQPDDGFTFSAVPTPQAPSITSYFIGMSITDRTPTLYWNNVDYAVSYQIQISSTADFSNIEQNQTVTFTGYTATTLVDGNYYARVSAQNINGVFSPWSATATFEIDNVPPETPTCTSPAPNLETTDTEPEFQCLPVEDGYYYEVELTGYNVGVQHFGDTSTHFTYYFPLYIGTYFWQARALDSAWNASPWSPIQTFKIISPANAVPIQDFSAVQDYILRWSPISWAVEYQVQVSFDLTFPPSSSWLLSSDQLWVDVYLYRSGTYYWRVRARDVHGNWGNWSAARSILAYIPATPTPSFPP